MAAPAARSRVEGPVGALGPTIPALLDHQVNMVAVELAKNQAMVQLTATPFLRVRERVHAWMDLGITATLRRVIMEGLRVPITGVPSPCPPRASGQLAAEFERLAKMGVARRLPPALVQSTRVWTPVFGIQKPDGRIRLVSDLRRFNALTVAPKFKAESLDTVRATLTANPKLQWGAKLDLKDAFFHLGMHKKSSRWLRCAVDSNLSGAYELMGMPFGLSLAPYWCQRLCRPVARHLRALGHHLVWYVDDVLVLGTTPSDVARSLATIIRLFTKLGLGLNAEKCLVKPTQKLEYLGLLLDLKTKAWGLVPKKQAELLKASRRMLKQRKAPPEALAALAGRWLYAGHGHAGLHGLGKVAAATAARLVNSSTAASKAARWRTPAELDGHAKKVIDAATKVLKAEEPRRISDAARKNTVVIYSDASDTGWGATFARQPSSRSTPPRLPTSTTISGRWTVRQAELHITKKEALAAQFALLAFLPYVDAEDAVLLRTDSVATRAALTKGSARAPMTWCVRPATRAYNKAGVQLSVEYVPSALNEADEPSRRPRGRNDYKLNPRWLQEATRRLDYRPETDLFATAANKSCNVFFSRHPEPGAAGTNALALSWTELNAPYANPPWPLLEAVINKLRRDKVARLMLVAPRWPSAKWWPALEQVTVKEFLIPAGESVYLKDGNPVPPPRWRTTVRIVSGTLLEPAERSYCWGPTASRRCSTQKRSASVHVGSGTTTSRRSPTGSSASRAVP